MPQKWEYTMYRAWLRSVKDGEAQIVPDAATLWQGANTPFSKVQELGEKGWEMVSAVPVQGKAFGSSPTVQILFIFKRPKPDSD